MFHDDVSYEKEFYKKLYSQIAFLMPKKILKIATLTLTDVKESILYILPYKMK